MNKSLILKLDNIYSSYGNVQVLNGVNLQVRKGEIVSLLGEEMVWVNQQPSNQFVEF